MFLNVRVFFFSLCVCRKHVILPWLLYCRAYPPREAFAPSDFSPKPPILEKVQNEAGTEAGFLGKVHQPKWRFLLGTWCNLDDYRYEYECYYWNYYDYVILIIDVTIVLHIHDSVYNVFDVMDVE